MEPRKCERCGAEYRPKRSPQRYCKPACGYDAKRKPKAWPPEQRPCVQCGEMYWPKSTNQKFCSGRCAERAKYERVRSDPDKWSAYLSRVRGRYSPTGNPPGHAPSRFGCEKDGCSGKHFALGLCRSHYRRRRWAEGRDGRGGWVPLGALIKHYGADGEFVEEPRRVVIRADPSSAAVFPHCPLCNAIMWKLPTTPDVDLRDCSSCRLRVRLNPEEVAWVISETPSTSRSRATGRFRQASTTR